MTAANELISLLVAVTAPTPMGGKVAAGMSLATPTWAASMADIRATLPYDKAQTVAFVAINNRLGLAIADSGAYQTVMDLRMA